MLSPQTKLAISALLVVSAYLGSYFVVKKTHTKWWFDKTTEEKGAYTFFDSSSQFDTFLCFAYCPLLELDAKLNQREWERDKW